LSKKKIIPNKGKLDKKYMYNIIKNIHNKILDEIFESESSNITSDNSSIYSTESNHTSSNHTSSNEYIIS
jgi:hypothetical protein